jgi:hypothetical protein
VVDWLLSHDDSPALARYVADAVLKRTAAGGSTPPAAAVIAHDRGAVLAGNRGPNNYVR